MKAPLMAGYRTRKSPVKRLPLYCGGTVSLLIIAVFAYANMAEDRRNGGGGRGGYVDSGGRGISGGGYGKLD